MRIEPGTSRRVGKGASDTWARFTKGTITVDGGKMYEKLYIFEMIRLLIQQVPRNCTVKLSSFFNLIEIWPTALQYHYLNYGSADRLHLLLR
jgi:hypothetical protein